jgi:hypothetical protein
MPQTTSESTSAPKEITLNLRLDPALKSEFIAASEAEAKPAAAVLRRLMREYVAEARRRTFLAEAERQSRLISSSEAAAAEEGEVMRWIENVRVPMPVEPDDEWFVTPPAPKRAQ